MATLLVFSTSIILSTNFKVKYYADKIIILGLLFLVQIVLSSLFLGVVVKRLYPLELFASQLVILAVALFLHRHKIKQMNCRGFVGQISRFIAEIRTSSFYLILFFLILAQIVWILFLGFLFPPYVWDAITYHLPSVAYWLQAGKIHLIDTPVSRSNIYPMNVELFFLWNVIFLGNDVLVDLSQFFFTLLGLLGIYALTRKIGVSTKSSLAASAIYFFTPLILIQSKTCQTDLAAAVLFLIALNFAFQYGKDSQISNLFISGVASGMLMGSKSTGLILVFCLYLYLLVNWLRFHSKKDGLPVYVRFMVNNLYFLIPVFILGSYWYLRNWVYFNNPVGHEIKIFGFVLFEGGVGPPKPGLTTLWANLRVLPSRWFELVDDYYNSDRSAYGPQWIILGIPSTAFFLVNSIKNKAKDNPGLVVFFILTFLFCIFILFPDLWSARLVLFLPAIGAVCVGYVLDNFSRKGRILLQRLILIVISWSIFNAASHSYFTPSRFRKFLHLPLEKRTAANFGLFISPAYSFIDNQAKDGDHIGYTVHGDGFVYPLFGSRLQRKVYYIHHDFSYSDMLSEIEEKKIKYLLTNANNSVDKLAESRPDIFLKVHSGKDNVYEVKGSEKGNEDRKKE
ncbi:hypothetical protein ES703_79876 [subsurface metagenome]